MAIVAVGDMGSWIARRLVPRGVSVRTVLAGRSAASVTRAMEAGVLDVADDDAMLAGADAIFSVVPPDAALPLAERMLPALSRAASKPVFVDCNALSRGTVERIAALIRPSGCPMVDAAIFGAAPPGDGPGPRFYLSGPEAHRLAPLEGYGLEMEVLDAPVGSASALKCCFAALGKGVAALGVQAFLAATDAGVVGPLTSELRTTFPDLARLLALLLPQAPGKAVRWVSEMGQIAADFAAVPAGPAMFAAAADLFEAVAVEVRRDGPDGIIEPLRGFARRLAAPP